MAGAQQNKGTQYAPEGQLWVCAACGKTSLTRYGFDMMNKRTCSPGWDESCMLNAVLCLTSHLVRRDNDTVVKILEGGIVENPRQGLATEELPE